MRTTSTNKKKRPVSLPKTTAFEHTAVEFTTESSAKRNTTKFYSRPPSYVSRAIPAEQVYDTRAEKSLILNDRLQYISEEPIEGHLQEPVEKVQEYSIDLGSHSSDFPLNKSNIFQAEQLDASRFQEHSKGPIYIDGKVVRHSIVGTVELFEKYHRKKLKASKQDTDTSSMLINDSMVNVSRTHTRPPSIIRDHPRSSSSGLRRIGESKKKDTRVPKEQVLAEIDNIKTRQDEFYQRIDRMAQSMKKSDMLYFTKEKRCLENFQKVEEHWDKSFEHTSSKLGRSPHQSVMLGADAYREKKEKAAMFDSMKNEEERFGTNLWYRTLRMPPGETDRSTSVAKDDRSGAQRSGAGPLSVDVSVEIIRKPRRPVQAPDESVRSVNRSNRISDRSMIEYMNRKLNSRPEFLEQFKTPTADVSDFMVIFSQCCRTELLSVLSWPVRMF